MSRWCVMLLSAETDSAESGKSNAVFGFVAEQVPHACLGGCRSCGRADGYCTERAGADPPPADLTILAGPAISPEWSFVVDWATGPLVASANGVTFTPLQTEASGALRVFRGAGNITGYATGQMQLGASSVGKTFHVQALTGINGAGGSVAGYDQTTTVPTGGLASFPLPTVAFSYFYVTALGAVPVNIQSFTLKPAATTPTTTTLPGTPPTSPDLAILAGSAISPEWSFVVDWATGPLVASTNGLTFTPLQTEASGALRVFRGAGNITGYATAQMLLGASSVGKTFHVQALTGTNGAGGSVAGYDKIVTVPTGGLVSFALPTVAFSYFYITALGAGLVNIQSFILKPATTTPTTTTIPGTPPTSPDLAILAGSTISPEWSFIVDWATGPLVATANGVTFPPLQTEAAGALRVFRGAGNITGYATAQMQLGASSVGKTFHVQALTGTNGAGGSVAGYDKTVIVPTGGLVSFALPTVAFSYFYVTALGAAPVNIQSFILKPAATAPTTTTIPGTPPTSPDLAILAGSTISPEWSFIVDWATGPLVATTTGVTFTPLQTEAAGAIRVFRGAGNITGYATAQMLLGASSVGKTFHVQALTGINGAGGSVAGYDQTVTVPTGGLASFPLPTVAFSYFYITTLGAAPVNMQSFILKPATTGPTTTTIPGTPTTSCQTRSGPIRVMPLGDSLTVGGYGDPAGFTDSFRYQLWRRLNSRTDLNFVFRGHVGAPYSQGFGWGGIPPTGSGLTEFTHSGMGGFNVNDIRAGAGPWVATADPDVIILNIGTNGGTTAEFNALVETLQVLTPHSIIVLGTLPVRRPELPSGAPQSIRADINTNVIRLANLSSTDRILSADVSARMRGGDGLPAMTVADFFDDTHMAISGGTKFGNALYPEVAIAIQMAQQSRCGNHPFLVVSGPTTPTTTTTPATTTTTTPATTTTTSSTTTTTTTLPPAPSPTGTLTSAVVSGDQVTVTGSASTPGTATSVQVLLDGVPVGLATSVTAPYVLTVTTPFGTHEVCTRATAGTEQTVLGCRLVNASYGNPFGMFETATIDGPNTLAGGAAVIVSGYVADPDNTTATITVAAYVNNTYRSSMDANKTRAEITGYGTQHGFSGTINVPIGTNEICLYAENIGLGENTKLGCKSVQAQNPWIGEGQIQIRNSNGTCVTPYNPNGAGPAVQMNVCNGTPEQAWVVTKNSNGTYQFAAHNYSEGNVELCLAMDTRLRAAYTQGIYYYPAQTVADPQVRAILAICNGDIGQQLDIGQQNPNDYTIAERWSGRGMKLDDGLVDIGAIPLNGPPPPPTYIHAPLFRNYYLLETPTWYPYPTQQTPRQPNPQRPPTYVDLTPPPPATTGASSEVAASAAADFEDGTPARIVGVSDSGCLIKSGTHVVYGPIDGPCTVFIPTLNGDNTWEFWASDLSGSGCLTQSANTLSIDGACSSSIAFESVRIDIGSFNFRSSIDNRCLSHNPTIAFESCSSTVRQRTKPIPATTTTSIPQVVQDDLAVFHKADGQFYNATASVVQTGNSLSCPSKYILYVQGGGPATLQSTRCIHESIRSSNIRCYLLSSNCTTTSYYSNSWNAFLFDITLAVTIIDLGITYAILRSPSNPSAPLTNAQEAENDLLRARVVTIRANSLLTTRDRERNPAAAILRVGNHVNEDMRAISGPPRAGFIDKPSTPLFNPGNVTGFNRPTDAEYKILEAAASELLASGKTNTPGYIILHTEKIRCPACLDVARQFTARFPKVTVFISWTKQ